MNTRELISSSVEVEKNKAKELNFLPANIVFDDQICK